jgi:hypothetical protein
MSSPSIPKMGISRKRPAVEDDEDILKLRILG